MEERAGLIIEKVVYGLEEVRWTRVGLKNEIIPGVIPGKATFHRV
jgi:hypothetical protein